MPMSPLSGIRVLDLSLQLPGPFCTLMMADHGADVIKVDEPAPRARNPFAGETWGDSPADRYLNRGKRSLTLNLKTEEGKEIFRALSAAADVVIEGFRPGVVERLGVDYATLSAANPRLVYCSVSGYGQTGPMRAVAGHDINYLSYAGVLGLCGREGEPPAIPPVQIGDLFGGAMMALSGILMALRQRDATGRECWVDISMTDGAMSMLSIHAAAVLAGMPPPERGRMILGGMFPCYETYRCACGGYVSVGALESWFWEDLLKAIGREDLAGFQYATGEEGARTKEALSQVSWAGRGTNGRSSSRGRTSAFPRFFPFPRRSPTPRPGRGGWWSMWNLPSAGRTGSWDGRSSCGTGGGSMVRCPGNLPGVPRAWGSTTRRY